MHRSIVFILTLVAHVAVAQEQRFVMPAPDAARFTVAKNIPIGSDAAMHADVYSPSGAQTAAPVVIVVNSTGADYTTWPGYIGLAQYLAANGIAAIVYQPSATAPATDFDALLATLTPRATALHLDLTRIVLWSASTNVTIGLPLAMDEARDYVRGAVVYYGYAPSLKTIRTDLPVFFVRSGLDSPNMNHQVDALLAHVFAANAPWTIENDASGHHAFDVFDPNEISRTILQRTLRFIGDVTQPTLAREYREAGGDAAIGAAVLREDWAAVIRAYRAKKTPLDAQAHNQFGVALLNTGEFTEALRELDAAWSMGRRGIRDVAYPAAKAAAGTGDTEHAIQWLNIVTSTKFGPPIAELRTSPAFAKIRDTPEFHQLLATLERQPH